jgi:putative ABC transport system permease protein
MGSLLFLLVLALGLVIFDALRRPSLRRLAVRNILRRPGEASLVVLGAMLGTAIITTSFVVGDTFGETVRSIAPQKLGEIDYTIWASERDDLLPAIAAVDVDSLEGIDGALVATRSGVTVATPGDEPGRLAKPSTGIEIDFDDARAFGSDVANTGLADAGPTPVGNEVLLGADVANKIDVEVGDEVEIHAYGTSRVVEVRAILERRGIAGAAFGGPFGGTKAFTAFLPPGTFDSMMAEGRSPDAAPPEANYWLSAEGGVFHGKDGATLGPQLFDELERRVSELEGVSVETTKADLVEEAEFQSSSLKALFGGIGGFSVIAGILLLVNIFVMLAEERKAELGVLRAVGLKRNHLVRTFGVEGAIYAAVAAVLGGFVGIAVGRVISTVAAALMSRGGGDYSLELTFTAKPSSVITGMLIGLLISMVTVWGTSLRIGRLNIIRAIREQADPPRDPRSRRSLVFGILGVVLGLLMLQAGVASKTAPPTSLGPAVALFSAILLLRRRIPERFAASIPAALVVLYELTCFAIFPAAYVDPGIPMFVIQGVSTSAAAVVLAAANADLIASLAERVAGAALAARLGVAYPLARRFRTGLLLGMYTLIIFTLTFMATLSHVFTEQTPRVADQMRGGFDLFVDSSWANPPTAQQIASQPGVETVAPLRRGGVRFQRGHDPEPRWWAVSGFDLQLLAGGAPALRETWQGISNDEAWALAAGGAFDTTFTREDGTEFTPIPAVIPNFFLQEGNGPPSAAPEAGMLVDIVHPISEQRQTLLAVGIVAGDWAGNGVFVNEPFLNSFVETTVVSRYFVRVADDADPSEVAGSLSAELIPHGVDAKTFYEMVEQGTASQAGFFRIIQGYLGLGLLVGVAGLGVVMVRAVRERRRQIGMLRAMGFQASVVRRAFLLEATFVASQGVAIGIGLGLLTSWSVMTNSEGFSGQGTTFAIPWATVLFLLVVPMIASLLAVLAPANSAAKVRPAIALRIAD